MNPITFHPPCRLQVFCMSAFVFLLGSPAPASLFPQLSARYPVGDPDVENPLGLTEGPKNLAAGDFNNDGKVDALVGQDDD